MLVASRARPMRSCSSSVRSRHTRIVGGLAFGGFWERLIPEPTRAVAWGGLHLFSVGLAIGVASLVAHLVENIGAWPLGGFLATTLYLTVSAFQLALAHAARRGLPPA